MNDRSNWNSAASSSSPPLYLSPPPSLQVPESSFGGRTNSDGPSTPSSARYSDSEHLRSSKKRKTGNKKPPVSYPRELKELIDRGFIIWGQHIPGIEAFEPSPGTQDHPHYSAFLLDSLESRAVTQAQAFSGRDDEVEEWATRRLASIPRAMLSISRSGVPPPIITGGVQRPCATYSGDGTTLSSSYHTDWAWTPPPFVIGQDLLPPFPTPLQAARSSPFSSDSVMTSFSAEDYYQGPSPPSTSSSYSRSLFAGPTSSATAPVIGQSNYQGALNYPPAPPAFGYSSAPPHFMGIADPFALQQALAEPVSMNYANSFSFDSAMAQSYAEQGHYQGAETPFDPSAALPELFSSTGSQAGQNGGTWGYS